MAFTPKAVNDHFLGSFGQIDEAVRSRTGNDGLIVGGIMEGTATAVEHGDFAALHFDANQNLMVNVEAGEIVASLGTLDIVKTGTIAVVSSVANVASGTLAVVSSVANVASGTLAAVSSVSNVANGTLAVVSSVANVASGTLAAVSSVANVATGTLATLGTVGVINAGSVVVTLGTSIVNAGTIQVNPKSPTAILMASALGTAGGSAFGTLIPAVGAGTVIYATGLQMVVSTGTVDCYMGYGTGLTGAAVLARGNFAANGGIVRDFSVPIASTANAELCYELAGAGTVFFAVNYWKA